MRILVVEDDPLMQRFLDKILSSAGHSVRMAESGPEAIKWLQIGCVCEVVITDLRMPGMTGVELFKAARDLKQLPVTPQFLLLTGCHPEGLANETSQLKEAVDLGFAGVLYKPVNRVHLLQTLVLLKEAKAHPSRRTIGRFIWPSSEPVGDESLLPIRSESGNPG